VIFLCNFKRAKVFRFSGFSNKGALCALSFDTNFAASTKGESMFENIKKRDGRVVPFDSSKITSAIAKAGKATGEFSEREAKKLTLRVLTLAHQMRLGPNPGVEEIQDIVERVLLDSPYYKTAKAYILYREQHAQIRAILAKASVDMV
jgi:anaerobic ribonucleoside-triphosphate reductase